jgi:hypothetical protein
MEVGISFRRPPFIADEFGTDENGAELSITLLSVQQCFRDPNRVPPARGIRSGPELVGRGRSGPISPNWPSDPAPLDPTKRGVTLARHLAGLSFGGERRFRVNFGLSRPTAATSAFRGKADEIGTITDNGQRMSPVGGRAVVLAYPSRVSRGHDPRCCQTAAEVKPCQ